MMEWDHNQPGDISQVNIIKPLVDHLDSHHQPK